MFTFDGMARKSREVMQVHPKDEFKSMTVYDR
jgi:hypothetical protein